MTQEFSALRHLQINIFWRIEIYFVIIAILVLIFPVKNSVEKTAVKSATEDYLQKIRGGDYITISLIRLTFLPEETI